MDWKTIRLELARTRDFPLGSVSRGYLIRLPLDDSGSIDDAALARNPQRATVRRFWSTEPDESGRAIQENGHLRLRCFGKPDRLLGSRSFDVGGQVIVSDAEGVPLPFRVASLGRVG